MISRVADQCFWMGRYLERAESTARVLWVTHNLALDQELTPKQCWFPVVVIFGEEDRFLARYGEEKLAEGELVQSFMAKDTENLASIRNSIENARENARSVRDVISREVWETLNELYVWLREPASQTMYKNERYEFYRRIRDVVGLTLGLTKSTMLEDAPLDFIWLGVFLERAGQTARLVDVHHHVLTSTKRDEKELGIGLWISLLRACSGLEPFMKSYAGQLLPNRVAAFLVLEARFPRSVRFCIRSAQECLSRIQTPQHASGSQALQQLRTLETWLDAQVPSGWDSETLHKLLTHVVDEGALIGTALRQEIFDYRARMSTVRISRKLPNA